VKTRIITGVIAVPLLVAALSLTPTLVTTLIVAVISGVSAWEISGAVGMPKNNTIRGVLTAVVVWCAFIYPDDPANHRDVWSLFLIFALLTFISAAGMLRFEKRGGAGMTNGKLQNNIWALATLVLPALLASLTWLRMLNYGRLLVLLPFVSVFLTDAGAYFTGIFFGRHKAFPKISPNKTVEGCIGGVFIGTAAVLAYGAVISAASVAIEASILPLILIGVAGALAAEFGDLAFSLIKRIYGIKDYGKIIPGHGGMLDRFDSLVFCAPAVFIIASWLPVFEAAL
jgi:phosphatidate cytidylyltransferase